MRALRAADRHLLSASAEAQFVVTPTVPPTSTAPSTPTPTPTLTATPAAGPALAATGSSNAGRLAGFGMLLLLAGAALILGGRSRSLR